MTRPRPDRVASTARTTFPTVVLLLTLAMSSCRDGDGSRRSAEQEPPLTHTALVIAGVTIVPMSGEVERLPDHAVWVEEGRIVAVAPTAELTIPPSARVVDGAGQYLIPGLADMHVHVDHRSELALYPAHGVTTVLNLRGLPKHLAWRDDTSETNTPETPSMRPTMLTAGDYLDGDPPFMRPMTSVSTADDAAAVVADQAEAGYDAIKVYSRLSAEQIEAIGRAAREAGLPVVGHGSGNYPLETLVRWQDNVAHGEELIRWYWDPERSDESLREIVDTLASSTTTVTANLNFSRSLIRQHQDLESVLALPVARALHPAIFQPFRRANNRYARRDDAWLGRVKQGFVLQKRLIAMLAQAGVTLLAGTDASTAGVYPGHALAEELEELVDAGLTPLQALRTATRAPGDFVARHMPHTSALPFGRIEVGYRADLVLLDANPLQDIGNVSTVAGVVLRGRWHPRVALEAALDALDASHEPLREPVQLLERMIVDGRIEEARALFDTTRASRPRAVLFSQYVPFFVGYGFLYGEGGYNPDPRRREVALGLYQMYAETYPDFHSAHFVLAEAHRALGNPEAALTAAGEALRLHPYHPEARALVDELSDP